MKELIIEKKQQCGVIRLNRLASLNALSKSMIMSMMETLIEWKMDPEILFVVITSNHPKVFCAGGDIKKVYEDVVAEKVEEATDYLAIEYVFDHYIKTYEKPIIMYADGLTFGGGLGLFYGASHRVISSQTKFAMPETKIGFFPDVGASYFLNELPNYVGYYLGMLGIQLIPSDILSLKMAHGMIDKIKWQEVEERLFTQIFSQKKINSTLSLFLNEYYQTNHEPSNIEKHRQTIQRLFSKPSVLEIINDLQLDDPFEKAIDELFHQVSPTAVFTTYQLLKTNQGKTYWECLKAEQTLSQHVVLTHDFKEGVRSLLVDKDQRFAYEPSLYNEETEKASSALFTIPEASIHPMDFWQKYYQEREAEEANKRRKK
ncbi:MAG: enoyl-CoA hydratase/isomerase family protein [Acholeplasmataceae bacterium]|nr:enoyl-CoA hydratase/isomerase family protein [Acholeplasmataceae bacterium]